MLQGLERLQSMCKVGIVVKVRAPSAAFSGELPGGRTPAAGNTRPLESGIHKRAGRGSRPGASVSGGGPAVLAP